MARSEWQVLAESAHHRLEHSFEDVRVVDKRDGSQRPAGEHYGDPQVGVITADEHWFCSGGEGVQCLSRDGTFASFFRGRAPWFVQHLAESRPQHLRVTFDDPAHGTWEIDLAASRAYPEAES